MKAAFLTGPRKMEVREAPSPRIQREDQVLLAVAEVGVCGSDVHTYRQGQIGGQVAQYPWIVGHECAGVVRRIGAEARGLRVGQRVAVDPLIACGTCDQCRAGRRHTCRNQQFLASPGQAPGALAEYLVMPAQCCLPIPDSMSFTLAALTEPFAIGLYAARLGRLSRGAVAAVLGCGPIGLSALMAVKAADPSARVFATDRLDYRLEYACRYGADWTGNPDRLDVVERIRQAAPEGAECVFECAGQQETVDQGIRLCRPGGMLLMVGIPEADRLSLDVHLARRAEIVIQNVRRQNQCVAPAIEMAATGRVDLLPLATHYFDLDHCQDAFETVADYRDGVVKAIVRIAGR